MSKIIHKYISEHTGLPLQVTYDEERQTYSWGVQGLRVVELPEELNQELGSSNKNTEPHE